MTADVSVILPCRNEARFIGPCLDSLLAQRLDGRTLEVIVIDGMSTDGTREIVAARAAMDARVTLLDNPRHIVPTGMNIALRRATAPVIARMDVHCVYQADYLAACLAALATSGADNVGGVVRTLPRGDGLGAETVAALSCHKFGVGDSRFRTGGAAGYVDTVPFGCYPRTTFERYGLFDERLVRNQDYEFNARLRAAGGTVWLDPTIVAEYFNQGSLRGLLRQALLTGRWNAFTWYVAPYSLRPRHVVPAIFVAAMLVGLLLGAFAPAVRVLLVATAGVYALLALAAAAQQAAAFRDPRLLLTLPPSFLAYHVTYGLGILLGAARVASGRLPFERSALPWRDAPGPRLRPSLRLRPRSTFDLVVAGAGLFLLSPLLAAIALVIRLQSAGPVIYRQVRVGYLGAPFTILKFRTMVAGADRMGGSVTTSTDARITPLGRVLRRTKLDELPQLWNVVRGEMALVGPRPDVPEVVANYTEQMRRVLDVPPGITSVASLELVDEERLLADAADPDGFYQDVLVPAKVRIAMAHVDDRSLRFELLTLWHTVVAALRRAVGAANAGLLAGTIRDQLVAANASASATVTRRE